MRVPDPGADPAAALAQVRDAVRREAPYRPTPRTARHKLNQNESPTDLPAAIKREVLERLAALPWNRYPEAVPLALLERLAERADWTAEGIVAGCGSNDLIQAVLTIIVGPGDRIVAPSPTFALYRRVVTTQGGEYHPVPLGPGLTYDLDAIISAARATRARAVILCTPNNPTGSDLTPDAVARVLAQTEGLVLVDEAYRDFDGESAVRLLPSSPRLVVFRTLSKIPGVAGLRFGYLLAHPAIATEVLKAKLPYDVSALTLAAVDVLLDHDAELRRGRDAIAAERERMMAACAALPGVSVLPSRTNFFLLEFESARAGLVAVRLWREHSVLVRDVSDQPGLGRHLRVSVGTSEDTAALLAGLRAVLGAPQ